MRQLKWTILLVAAVALLTLLLAGCSSGGPTSAPTSSAPKASGAGDTAAKQGDAVSKPTAKAADTAPKASDAGSKAAAPAAEGSPQAILEALAKLPPAERQQKLEEGARKEGKVIAYVTGDIQDWEAWKRDFQSKYPYITFDFQRDNDDPLLEKILAENRAGKLIPDIVKNAKLDLLQEQGIIIPYSSPAKDAMPKNMVDAYAARYEVNPIVIAWNTNLVKPEDAPKKWEDLLDAKWKGRKMALDAQPDVMMYGMYIKWGVEKGRDYVRQLMAQDVIPGRSHTTELDQLAAGEFPLVVEAYGYRAIQLSRAKKAPLGWVIPDPMPTTAGGLCITKTASHPYSAALLMDYIMTGEAGTLLGKSGRMPTQPGAELQFPDDQRPLLTAPSLMVLGRQAYVDLYDTVQKDIKDIVQSAMGL